MCAASVGLGGSAQWVLQMASAWRFPSLGLGSSDSTGPPQIPAEI